jgi:hypothetical protein
LLDGMREVNHQVDHLIQMLHPALGHSLSKLQKLIIEQGSECSQVLENDWSSPYPCAGFGFNRTTSIHRDSKGLRNGLEVLFLLGEFEGGKLRLQDLNMELEWLPRFLCVFDGHTFSHEVAEWSGGQRTCFIYFCRATTFQTLGAPVVLPAARLGTMKPALRSSHV